MEQELHSLLDDAAILHGHHCPGLALGVKGSVTVFQQLDVEHEGMEDLIAIVETNNCFSDGVQYVSGCTFGNNSLVFRDFGKMAVTFVKRGEQGLRLTNRADAGNTWNGQYPRYRKLFEKVVKQRKGTKEDSKKMMEMAGEISHSIMDTDSRLLFDVELTETEIPDYAPIHGSGICISCGESMMSTRIVKKEGKDLCIPCSGDNYFELDGHGIHLRNRKR